MERQHVIASGQLAQGITRRHQGIDSSVIAGEIEWIADFFYVKAMNHLAQPQRVNGVAKLLDQVSEQSLEPVQIRADWTDDGTDKLGFDMSCQFRKRFAHNGLQTTW